MLKFSKLPFFLFLVIIIFAATYFYTSSQHEIGLSDQSEKEIQFLPPLDTESSSPVIKSQLQQLNQIQKEVEIIYEETKELGQQNDFRSDDSELSNTEVSQKIDDLNIRLEHLKRLEGYHD